MKAKKENKVYTINNNQKQEYRDKGYDIYDDKGVLIEYSSTKTIHYEEHIAVLAEKDILIDELKEELEKVEEQSGAVLAENVMDLLKGYASAKGIDYGAASSASGVLNKILEVEKE